MLSTQIHGRFHEDVLAIHYCIHNSGREFREPRTIIRSLIAQLRDRISAYRAILDSDYPEFADFLQRCLFYWHSLFFLFDCVPFNQSALQRNRALEQIFSGPSSWNPISERTSSRSNSHWCSGKIMHIPSAGILFTVFFHHFRTKVGMSTIQIATNCWSFLINSSKIYLHGYALLLHPGQRNIYPTICAVRILPDTTLVQFLKMQLMFKTTSAAQLLHMLTSSCSIL